MSNDPAPAHFDRLAELFRTAVSLDDDGRVALLDRARDEDPSLADELSELLSFDDPSVATRLEPLPGVGAAIRHVADDAPSGGSDARTAATDRSDPSEPSSVMAATALTAGQRIADFEIVGPIAAGGMGVVYEARQDHPARRVAVKVMRAGLGSPRPLARFRFEADVLARLDHPGIAAIHAAGTLDGPSDDGSATPSAGETGADVGSAGGGVPWMAMEFIEGAAPITRAATARGLDVRARVGLLLDAARAMRHAHQRGIIHRDLKPGNILVGRDGRARVIDFGVARDVDRMSQATRHTAAGDLLGTLAYMSPEQCRGNPDAVDVRSDVYALGILLHELVNGRKPINLDGLSLGEAVRQVTERGVPPMESEMPGVDADLQTVARVATALDPRDRYQSMDALVVDLEHWLRGDPVSARPPGPIRRVRLFVRQHPAFTALIGLSAAFAAVIVLLIGAYGVQITRESEARQQALERSDSMLAFLKGILVTGEFNVDAATGHDLRSVLTAAAARIDREFADDPAAAGDLWAAIGSSFRSLGDAEMAARSFERQRQLALEAFGEDSSPYVEALTNVAAMLADDEQIDASEAMYLQAQEIARRNPDVLRRTGMSIEYSLLTLQYARRQYGEIIEPLRDLAARMEQRLLESPNERQTRERVIGQGLHVSVRRMLGLTLTDAGRVDEGIELLQQLADEIEERPSPTMISVLNDLGWAQLNDARFEDALTTFRRAEALSIQLLGADTPRTEKIQTNIADLFVRAGRTDDAIEYATRRLESRIAANPDDPRRISDIEQVLWAAHLDAGNIPAALATAESAHARLADHFGDENIQTARPAQMIGLALGQIPGREAEGLTHLARSRDIIRDAVGADSLDVARAENELGVGHFRLGGWAAAAMHFQESLRINRIHRAPDDVEILKGMGNLGRAWLEAGDIEAAIVPLDEAGPQVVTRLPERHPVRIAVLSSYGEVLAALDRCEEAIMPLEIGLAGMRSRRGDADPRVRRMQAALDSCRAATATATPAEG